MYCHLSVHEPFSGVINHYKVKLSDKIPLMFKYPSITEVNDIQGNTLLQPATPNFQSVIKDLINCSFCHSTWIAIFLLLPFIGILAIPFSYFYFVIIKKLF